MCFKCCSCLGCLSMVEYEAEVLSWEEGSCLGLDLDQDENASNGFAKSFLAAAGLP